MGKKRGSNEDIRIGGIFECWDGPDMLQPDSDYYQVVALRGKTQVVLRPLQMETYINEGIAEDSPLHWGNSSLAMTIPHRARKLALGSRYSVMARTGKMAAISTPACTLISTIPMVPLISAFPRSAADRQSRRWTASSH